MATDAALLRAANKGKGSLSSSTLRWLGMQGMVLGSGECTERGRENSLEWVFLSAAGAWLQAASGAIMFVPEVCGHACPVLPCPGLPWTV
jgi:hypothetical protein